MLPYAKGKYSPFAFFSSPKTSIAMSKKNNSRWAFGLGLLAGALAGYYLNSNQGREWRRRTRQQVNEMTQEVSDRAREQFNQLTDKVEALTRKAQSYFDNLTHSAEEKVEKAKHAADEVAEEVKSSFQKGVDKARRKVNAKKGQTDSE
jgi:gas vesicle protein